jgi:hypothetical protein
MFVLVFYTLNGEQVYAQLDENLTSSLSEPSFLFIQSAQSGSLSQINDTAYSLELNDIADKTVSFSDRPYRIVESIDTSEFVGNWSNTSEDCFAIDPPNAALVVLDNSDATSEQDLALVELFDPVYDGDRNALTYDARPDNATSIDLPDEFGQSVMIIDNARLLHWVLVADRLTDEPQSNLNDSMHFSSCK